MRQSTVAFAFATNTSCFVGQTLTYTAVFSHESLDKLLSAITNLVS